MKVAEIIDPDKPFKFVIKALFGPEQWIQPNIVDVLEDLLKKELKKFLWPIFYSRLFRDTRRNCS